MTSVIKKLIAAREGFKDIKKDVKGYDYKYADLEGIMHAIDESLQSAGVHIHWTFDLELVGTETWLNCQCVASDGESELSTKMYLPTLTLAKSRNAVQEMGKLYTYARRYSLSALLNLVSEQDTDASHHATIVMDQPKPTSPVVVPPQSDKPFVDHQAAWAWLEGLFMKYQVTSPTTQKFIRENAIGKMKSELEKAVISASTSIGQTND